ncbi:Ig-like domain-containing protein [Actinoplanes subtropicus]|uniref:Ig-like domain-containing protein n=1 Tax=Actinoplanes subtropicus TaxID=543632 RepID=UPI0004C3FF61|nr:Ig-like domain-containing protein [Actinoplanes subtropicus]
MRIKSRIAVASVATAATAAAVLGVTGGAALAAPPAGTLGTLTNNPATGTDLTAPKVHTSAGCSTDSDSYRAVLTGPGAFAPGVQVTQPQSVNFSTTDPFDVQVENSFKDVATDLGTTIVAGEYDLTVQCLDAFSQDVKGTFTGAFYFTSATAYQSTDPNASTPSSTSLDVTPAGPVNVGDTVTLKATVAPATATGSVQFKDGANNLGSAVAVSGGVASLATAALASGTHAITAVFTSTSPGVNGSASAATNLVVNAAAATATTTALVVNPSGSVEKFSPITLSASVSPSGAAGKIQFLDAGANLGAAVTVANGTATLTTSSLAEGDHSLAARFVPADSGAYAASESPAVAVTVTPFKGGTASQTISTTVASGALTISVGSTDPVVLPDPALASDASKLTTAGNLNSLTVTDTRAGNLGWNVSGQVSDFSDGKSHSINAANLGWTPKVVDKSPSQTVTAGAQVNPADAIAPGAAAPSGVGLASSRTLAAAAAGAGMGTAHVSASVALQAPTTTVAGTYSATLTITAI